MRSATPLASAIIRVRESQLGRFGFATLVAFAFVGLRELMSVFVPVVEAPYILGVVGAAVSAWFGGWAAGALTTLIVLVLLQTMWVLPAAHWDLDSSRVARAIGFTVQSMIVAVLIDSLVRSRREGQMRGDHQDLRNAATKAILAARSDADAISDALRAVASKFRATAGVAWWLEGGGTIARAVYRPERGEARHSAEEVEEMDRLLAASTDPNAVPHDAVRAAVERAAACVGYARTLSPELRHVMAIPAVPVGGTAERLLVFELRRATPFASDRRTVASLSEVGAEIAQSLRSRTFERTVNRLSKRLAERAQELQAVLDTSPIGIAVSLDDRCDQLVLNAAGAAMLGSRIRASSIDAPASPAEEEKAILAPLEEPMRRSMSTAHPVGPVEFEATHPDGARRNVYEYASPLIDHRGRIRGSVAAFVDITELRTAERVVRERERAFRRSFESAGVGKAQIDARTGCFEMVNRRLCAMLGRTAEELKGYTFMDTLEPNERNRAEAMLSQLVAGGDREASDEFRFQHSSGSTLYGAISMTVACDDAGSPTHIIVVIQDVTDRTLAEGELARYRTRLEELVAARTAALEDSHMKLRLSERMAALGTLCAGLGHDMGNLLLPVRLRLEAIGIKGVPPAIEEDVKAIGKCAEYLQRLANGLRLLSLDPDRSSAVEITDLTDWWSDVESFLKNCLPRGIELERRFEAHLPKVAVSRHRLTQAIFNLVQNAGDAFAERNEGWVRVVARTGSKIGTVHIEVSDNGAGMTPDVRARCLEPFFTSKARGISTGLGLSLVHGIVQQSGGSIDVVSEQGRGTTFTLTFQHAPEREVPVATKPMRGPIKVIVALDEPRLRSYSMAVARTLDCDVVEGELPSGDASDAVDENGCIWITSADRARGLDIARAFATAGGSQRKLIIFGESPDRTEFSGDVQWLSTSTPSLVWRALRKSVTELANATQPVTAESVA